MYALGASQLGVLNFKKCMLNKNDIEVVANTLYNTYENYAPGLSTLRVLNLSMNMVTKEGAKFLAAALEKNTTLEVLDLS